MSWPAAATINAPGPHWEQDSGHQQAIHRKGSLKQRTKTTKHDVSHCIYINPFSPKQCGHTEGVLTVGVRARCSFQVVSPVSGQFPVNFRIEWLLWNVHVHFDCAGSHKTRHLIQKSCQETSYRELVAKSCKETAYGDLVQRSCQETSCRNLAQRTLVESLYRDLARRPLTEILYRDLVKRAAILLRDLFQRAWTEILLWDLSDLL